MEAKRKEEEGKNVKRRFQEFQRIHINCDKEKKDFLEKLSKGDKERAKINDKYIKLS